VSVLALAGVVLTLGYQARETKRAREETRRQAISDLLKMAMEDPELDEYWGPILSPDDPKSRKQQLYKNMIIAAWEMAYETGATPENRLRYNANEMFSGEAGRTFWRNSRESRPSTSANRRERRFHQILDEEYQRAIVVQSGSHPVTHGQRRSDRRLHAAVRRLALPVAGAALSAIVCRILRSGRARARRDRRLSATR
jgi:Family of unknown function (DUF6082)